MAGFSEIQISVFARYGIARGSKAEIMGGQNLVYTYIILGLNVVLGTITARDSNSYVSEVVLGFS